MNDLEKAKKVMAERPFSLTEITKKTNISYSTIKHYAKNPDSLKDATWSNVSKLAGLLNSENAKDDSLEQARELITKKILTLVEIAKKTGIAYPTLRTYVVNPDKLKNVSWKNINKLANLYKEFEQNLLKSEAENTDFIKISPKINLTFNGKKYYRLGDLAKDYNISARLVNQRWVDGHRDPKILTSPNINTYQGIHSIIYRGVYYKSALQFSNAYKLNYKKVIALIKQGVTNPKQLIEEGKTGNYGVEVLNNYVKNEIKKKELLVNSKKLFTAVQVSEITNISPAFIYDALKAIVVEGQNKSSIGLLDTDIVKIHFNKSEDKKLVGDSRLVSKFGFKASAITHILAKQKHLQQLDLKLVPINISSFDYLYSPKTHELFRSKGQKIIKIKRKNKDEFWIVGNKKTIILKIADIQDMLDNPSIKYDDLLTKSELIKTGKVESNIASSKLPKPHVRINNNGQKKKGWTKQEISNYQN